MSNETVNHPAHYGGADNPYEAIKIIDALGLGFSLGNALKYICRAGNKTVDPREDLKKAVWYLQHELDRLEEQAGNKTYEWPDQPAEWPPKSHRQTLEYKPEYEDGAR